MIAGAIWPIGSRSDIGIAPEMAGANLEDSEAFEVPQVPYIDRQGRSCVAYQFAPDADYSRGHVAFDSSVIDAVIVSIDPDSDMPVRCATYSYSPPQKLTPGESPTYWMVPLAYKNDWFMYGPRVDQPKSMMRMLQAKFRISMAATRKKLKG